MHAPNVIRTLAIVRRLADGYMLQLPDGVLGMGEDMSIGYAMPYGEEGTWGISPFATMDLAALDALLTRYGIGHPLPPVKVQDHVRTLLPAGLRFETEGLRQRDLQGDL